MSVRFGLTGNGIVILPAVYVWCWITVGVLMLMDTMECFLHALRLHW